MTTIAQALEEYGHTAYVLTVSEDGPHTSHTTITVDGALLTGPMSKTAARNAGSRPAISLFWPPKEPGGYGIIMNGTATVTDTAGPAPVAAIALTKAVFHRPGVPPVAGEGTCTSDCRPIRLPS